MTSLSNQSPPFSPVGSFVPRPEFQQSEARQSAIASLSLSGTGGIRLTGVQQELIYYLNSLFARPTNFIATATPPASTSNANVVPRSTPATLIRQATDLPSISAHPSSQRAPPHQATGSTTASSNVADPSVGPPIWRAGLVHSSMLSGQSGAWEYTLAGSPFRVPASEELATVRLLIALIQTLARFGWTLGAGVQAGRKRDDHHTWILISPPTGPPREPSVPTQSFAISFPRPNVVSVIDPPQNLTPWILAAVRAASEEAEGIVEEGWVKGTQRNPGGGSGGGGAYKFKLKGYTKWFRPGFPRARYEANTPPLLAKLLSALDSAGMTLAVSCQIRPTSYHRDLWIITSSTPVPASSNQWAPEGTLSRTGTATTTGSKTTVPILRHPKYATSPTTTGGPHSRQASTSSVKAPYQTHHSKQGSSSSIGSLKRGSLLTKKASLTRVPVPAAGQRHPPASATGGGFAPPPSAFHPPPSASPRKLDFAALPVAAHHQQPQPSPASEAMSVTDSGVAGVGANERATPFGAGEDAFGHRPEMMVPMKVADGGGLGVSKFAEGRDSTVSMGETVDGEEASRHTVVHPIESNGIQDPNRITEVSEPASRQTYATQASWEPVVEPGPGGVQRPPTQFYTPGNELQDQPAYPYELGAAPPVPSHGSSGGVPRLRELDGEKRRGESLLRGED